MNSKAFWLLTIPAFMLILILIGRSCGSKQPESRNRVPNFSINGQELADLKQQLADTKAAAAQAQQAANDARIARNDMQAQLEQLAKDAKQPDNKPAPTTDEPKEGRQEMTRPGIITDFGEYDLQPASNVTDYYIGFNFTDRNGFTKRFFPVCPAQTVKTGVSISIIYHWRSWQENQEGKRGCFQIDGFQVQ
jgi:hypothetical protein